MFTSWDNVNLEKYPWYAGKLERKEASEYLYRFPIGKVWVCCITCHLPKLINRIQKIQHGLHTTPDKKDLMFFIGFEKLKALKLDKSTVHS